MESLALLRGARALFSDPQRWHRRAAARTTAGRPVGPKDPGAYSFCSVGVLAHLYPQELAEDHPVFEYLARGFGVPPHPVHNGNVAVVVTRNDHGTYEEVLAAFDNAIALAEEDMAGAPLPAVERKELVAV